MQPQGFQGPKDPFGPSQGSTRSTKICAQHLTNSRTPPAQRAALCNRFTALFPWPLHLTYVMPLRTVGVSLSGSGRWQFVQFGRNFPASIANSVQVDDAAWISLLMSLFAAAMALSIVIATFYFIRCAFNYQPSQEGGSRGTRWPVSAMAGGRLHDHAREVPVSIDAAGQQQEAVWNMLKHILPLHQLQNGCWDVARVSPIASNAIPLCILLSLPTMLCLPQPGMT